jgi:CheY-like chemotaxis protein
MTVLFTLGVRKLIERPAAPLLIVEDSEEDFQAFVLGLRRAGFSNPVHRCSDGDEALDFLNRRGTYSSPGSAPRPSVVVLDLNLPGTDGRAVLHEMKNQDKLRTIPVIIFTTSNELRDVDACYRSGANAYVQKPMELRAFMDAVSVVGQHWCKLATLPE